MKRLGKWILGIVGGLLALVLVVVGGFILRDRILYADFYGAAQKGMKIPGLWDGYVSQGFDYDAGADRYLTCGYHKDGKASRIYVIEGEKQTRVDMKCADGSDYTGHTGGIDTYGPYVYVTANEGLDLFLLTDVLDGDGTATQVGTFATVVNPAYCTVVGDTLYTGAFYRPENYETPMEHRFTTPAGDQNTALLSVYSLNPATGLPLSETPDRFYSTTSQVQGMTFTEENTLVFACSYGLADSTLLFYDLTKLSSETASLTVNGVSVPVLFLDSAAKVGEITAPPMAEEIVWKDGRLWVMNESACTKYWFGKLTTGNHVYGVTP